MRELAYHANEHHYLHASQQVKLFEVAGKMQQSGLSDDFIATATRLGLEYEGIADLIEMWNEEANKAERDEIIADIQDLILDCSQQHKEEMPYIKFNDLKAVAQDIRAFKDSLLQIVDDNGGITSLAKRTDIPQKFLGTGPVCCLIS